MYKTILVPIDVNEETSWKLSLPKAVELAQTFGSELHVMTVVPDMGMPIVAQFFPSDYETKLQDTALKKLEEVLSNQTPKDLKVQATVCQGSVYEEVLATAKDIGADLIMMASHRPELSDFLLGPNAARVVRHANCSVLVVRG